MARRAKREVAPAWNALAFLAGDERGPVRVGTGQQRRCSPNAGAAGALLGEANDWLEIEDREVQFGAAGVVVELFAANKQVLASLGDRAALDHLSRAMAEASGASRAAERSDGRRRLLMALPNAGGNGEHLRRPRSPWSGWLEEECRAATHPDLRVASNAIVALSDKAGGGGRHH